jgi:hypothetical protein
MGKGSIVNIRREPRPPTGNTSRYVTGSIVEDIKRKRKQKLNKVVRYFASVAAVGAAKGDRK